MRRFNDSMASDSRMISLVLREMASVFEGVGSVVDVGGGTGTTAKIICDAFPELKCTVLDRPEVVDDLSGNDKLSYVGGDMLDSIPKADAVLLKVCIMRHLSCFHGISMPVSQLQNLNNLYLILLVVIFKVLKLDRF